MRFLTDLTSLRITASQCCMTRRLGGSSCYYKADLPHSSEVAEMLPTSLPAKRNIYGRALFDAELQDLRDNDTYVTRLLKALIEQKATYERRGFVESLLDKIRCMSWSISTNVHHTTHLTWSGYEVVTSCYQRFSGSPSGIKRSRS